jgi:cobalt-zinc-cadmium resistance protein CzcA
VGHAHPGLGRHGLHRRAARPIYHAHQLLGLIGVGFLALFGVSVQTGVIMIEFINQLRARRKGMEESTREHIVEAAIEGAVLRLRPIMMTMLVATLGLLPAALSHAIGSDSQRPFAIVIVGGLLANLVIGVFLLPTLYVWMAREDDVLPAVESTEDF